MPIITTSDGLPLSYATRGDADGAPVLFLHGFPLSSQLWDDAAGRLPQGFRAVLPDLRGHGATPPAPPGKDALEDPDPSVSRLARDLGELLDALGERRPAVLVGHSMGGYIAFEFFRLFPERTRALVLVCTRANADTEEAARARQIQIHTVLRDGSVAIAEQMLPRLFASSAPDSLREHWRGVMAGSDPRGVAWTLRALARRPDSTPTLPTIRIPTLIFVGAEDQITPPAVARAMHESIPGSRLEVVPGAAHMLPVEQPHAFATVLSEFLSQLP